MWTATATAATATATATVILIDASILCGTSQRTSPRTRDPSVIRAQRPRLCFLGALVETFAALPLGSPFRSPGRSC